MRLDPQAEIEGFHNKQLLQVSSKDILIEQQVWVTHRSIGELCVGYSTIVSSLPIVFTSLVIWHNKASAIASTLSMSATKEELQQREEFQGPM